MDEFKGKVCIIEDMSPIRKLLKTILEKAGLETADFSNGKSFFEWMAINKPLAVVVDILLPDMNGAEILQFIRNLPDGEKVPVIAVTGFAQASDKEKYLQMGFDTYISKPINTASFPDEVKSIIKTKRSV